MTQMKSVTLGELEDRIAISFASDNPLFVHGAPGIGKSDTVERMARQFAEEQNREFVHFEDISVEEYRENAGDYFLFVDHRLAQSDATDSKGLPDLNEESDYTEWKLPAWAYALIPNEPPENDEDRVEGETYVSEEDIAGFVFCDELNNAPQLVQKAFYKMILDRKAGKERLSGNVYLMAAGNRGKDNAQVNAMPTPLRNRFGHVELTPPRAGKDGNWTEWAQTHGIEPEVIGFLASEVGSRHLFEFDTDDRETMAFATPRTWEMASDAISVLDDNADNTEIMNVVAMYVGEGVASNFHGFLNTRDEIDLERYLNNPSEAAEINSKAVDVKHALVSAVAERYRNQPDSLESVIKIASHLDTEFGAFLLSMCNNYNQEHFRKNAPQIDALKELSEEYINYIDI